MFITSCFQMDLVCERAALPELTQTIFVIGVMVGAIVFSVLADKLGRKTVHLGCLWTVGVIGALSALSNDYVSYSVLRFVLGFLQMVRTLELYLYLFYFYLFIYF